MSTNDVLAALSISDRVSAGIDFLDRERPGWDGAINLDTLNLDSCARCILGQLFGSFGIGQDELDLTGNDTIRLGFDRHVDEPPAVYEELTAAWMDAIRARLAGVR